MMSFQSADEVVSAIKRRLGLIILVTLIGCALSVAFALTRTPTFHATAVVQIEDAQVSGAAMADTGEGRSQLDGRRTVRLIEQRVMSRDTLMEVMEKFDLFSDDPSMTLTQRIVQMREAAIIEPILSGEVWEPDVVASGIVINVFLDDAEKAAAVANELLDRVLAEARNRSLERARVELEFFNTEQAQVSEAIVLMEDEIAAYKAANSEAVPSNVPVLQSERTTLNTTLLALRQQVLALEASSERTRRNVLQRQLDGLREQISLIEGRIGEITGLLVQAPAIERELVAKERQLQQLNEQFTAIARRKADAEMSMSLQEQRQLERFEVLESAIAPRYAVSRSKREVAMMGGVASVILAIGLAMLLEVLNPGIRTAAQMERYLGTRPVISIPHIAESPNKSGNGKLGFKRGLALGILAATIALVAKPIIELARFSVPHKVSQ